MPSHKLHTEITIQAEPLRIWEILTDFQAYPDWNPFIRRIQGDLAVGSRLEVRMQASGAQGITFRPKVLKVEPGSELRWLGHLLFPGLFDGEHIFEIMPMADSSVRFIQRENLNGLTVPLLRTSLDRDTHRGFEEMNQALKERTEGLS